MGILLDPNALFVPTKVLPTLSPTYATSVRGTATPFKGVHLNYTFNKQKHCENAKTLP